MASAYFHMVPSWTGLRAPGPERIKRYEIASETYQRLCQMQGQRSVFDYTVSSYKVASFAKRSKDPELVARAYSKLGLNCGMFALGGLVMGFVRRAQEPPRNRADGPMSYGIGRGMSAWRPLLSAAGSTRPRPYYASPSDTLDKVGDWFGLFSHHVLRHLYAVRGDIPRELVEAEAEITIGTLCGDAEFLAWGQFGKADALARIGRLDEASELANRSLESLTARRATAAGIASAVLGFVRLQASDYTGARAALEQSRSSVKQTLSLIEFVADVYPMLVESLLGPRWADAEGGPSRSLARKARRESRFARFIGWRYPNYGPHALRVSGRAAFALGRKKQAARYLERSIAAAEKLGARYDLARALLDASLVIPDKADDYRRRGQQLLAELGAVVPEAERLPR